MRPQSGFAAHVARLGRGPRPALALHCTLAFSGAWAGLMRHVGEDMTLVAPDMPSHGRSPDWDGTSDFSDTAFSAARASLSEPMDLIGHSFGGVIALRLAVEHPELVRSLTMIEPVFFRVAHLDAPEVAEEHTARGLTFYEALEAGDPEEAARRFNQMWSNGPDWADMPAQVRAAMTRAIPVVPDTQPFLFDDAAGLIPRLSSLTMPVLLLRGSECDPVVTVTNDGLARRIAGARNEVVDGAGHMAPVTHPKQVSNAWREVLAPAEA